jgi:hypothetical protein
MLRINLGASGREEMIFFRSVHVYWENCINFLLFGGLCEVV